MDDPTRTLPPSRVRMSSALGRWGSFELLECVGRGGFGEVYRAFDPSLQREVAVKLLWPELDESRSRQQEHLLREARAMARVVHPNVVPVYGVDFREGRAGFWTAFVRGKTLSGLLAANGPFGPQETVLIGIDLCRALSAVHGAGLLHRDVKPGNVMREKGGRILLMDFGLTDFSATQTFSGGTPRYMAPEVLAGEPASVRSDIFALGVLLYHLLTGRFPEKEHWSLLEHRPDLAAALVGVIHQAIERDAARRFASAAEMAAALAEATGAKIAPVEPANRAPGWKKLWKPIAAVMLVFVALAAGYEWHARLRGGAAPAAVRQQYDAAHDLVRHYYRPGALDTAIPQLQAITWQAPEFAAAFADLGRANFYHFWEDRDMKYVEPARNASLKAIAIDSNLASAHVTLGMLYTQTGKNDLAAEELDKALRIDRLNAEAWAARAELYMRQGRVSEVEAALHKAADLDTSDWRWPKQLFDFYYRTGKTDLAIAAGQDTVRLSPDNARAYNNLGLSLWYAWRLPEAQDALRKAVSIEMDYKDVMNLGRVEQGLGHPAEAEKLFQQASALNPSDYLARCLLGILERQQNEDPAKVRPIFQKAIELAESLRKSRPEEVYLLGDLALMYAEIGDADHTLPLFRQAIALAPENNETLYLRGRAFELLHQRAEAIDSIMAAMRDGFSRDAVEQNPDLAALRKDPKYVAAVKSLQ
ncbi:MAG TPA: protein kinase [Bryobacteraceae bacterium]